MVCCYMVNVGQHGSIPQPDSNNKNMRYLITGIFEDKKYAFFTDWFESENHYMIDQKMIVSDLANNLYTTDGITWNEIEFDHL